MFGKAQLPQWQLTVMTLAVLLPLLLPSSTCPPWLHLPFKFCVFKSNLQSATNVRYKGIER